MIENYMIHLFGKCFVDHIMYWGLVILGTFFRYGLLKYKIYIRKIKVQKIIRDIVMVIVLTLMCNGISTMTEQGENVCFVMLLLMIYCIYVFVQKCPGGYTESVLLVVNSFLVTVLSFMTFPYNIVMVLVTIWIAILAFKYWPGEDKSDLIEIIVLSIEAVMISLYILIKKIDGVVEFTAVVIFVETGLFMINCVVKSIVKFLCGEDVDEYWDKLMGLY